MSKTKPPSVEALRRRLTDIQRAILNEIWRYRREDKKLISAVGLYNKFGKDVVESSLKNLGGSVALRSGNPDTGRTYYQITFLGIMLTDQGKEAQELLEKYLTYLHSRLMSEPELGGITNADFERDLGFTNQQLDLFMEVITLGPFWTGRDQASGTWTLNAPRDIDSLAVTKDVHQFFEERVTRDYDPDKPLAWSWHQPALRTGEDEDVGGLSRLALTKTKLGVLGLGSYVLYVLYVVSSEAGQHGGLYAFQYRSTWWMALGQTLWFLIAVLAALLLASVLGPERFLSLFPPLTRRLSLLKPIVTEVGATLISENDDIGQDPRGSFSEETGLGFQLYLDYNESIKRVYNNAILQYRNSFYFSLIFAVIGFGVIFYTLIFRNNGNTSWPAVVVSAVIEAVPALFFYLSDKARKQMIDVFVDLRQDNEVARAYELLRTLKDTDRQEALKEEIIRHTLLTAFPTRD